MLARGSTITRAMVLALACLIAGCATWPGVNDGTPPASPPSGAAPAPGTLPPNAFGPEPSHYFGTGGP